MRQSIRKPWILAAVMAVAGASACLGDSVTILKGTDVPVVFDESISSKTAKAGDRVMLHVADNVSVGGHIVIREGTKVAATVTSVEKRKHFGISAKMKLAFDSVHSAWGQAIPMEPKTAGKYSGSRSDKAGYAAGGGALLLGPVGLVGGYFVVGKQVNIKAGDRMLCEVSRDTALMTK